jgi:hypothetical protein
MDGLLSVEAQNRGAVRMERAYATENMHERQRLALLRRWEREGITPVAADADTINEGVRVLATGLPPRTAAQIALDAAEAVDQALEQLSAEMVAQIETGGQASILRRAVHRRGHLDRIEQALSA